MAPKNVIIALIALCSFAYGQTRSLLVDTNGIVQYTNNPVQWQTALSFGTNAAATRSNLSLGLPALTNTSNAGLLSAIGGLATNGSAANLTNFPAYLMGTNGDASTLTNFPTYLLRTNGDASALTNFPASLLRTNGDGSGLTNLPNANLTNATGVLPVSNGGTGATNASLAISNLLPSYTGNSNRFLALNSNATALSWVTNAGGGLPEIPLSLTNGGTGGTNYESALYGLGIATTNNGINLHFDGGTNTGEQHVVIGRGAWATSTNGVEFAVAIGATPLVYREGVAIGSSPMAYHGIAIGASSSSEGQGVALGTGAAANGGTNTTGGIAIGYYAYSDTNLGIAIGTQATADNGGVVVGSDAEANNSIQIGTGTNTNPFTIQFYNAGQVTTNAWTALANSTTFGHYVFAAPTNGTNGQVLALNSNATSVIWTNASATYPSFSNNASKVLAVATNESGVEWIAVSNTVTDAASLTNFPAYLLRTNGSGAGLTNIARPAYTNAEASMYEFLFADSNSYGLNLHWVNGTNASNQHIVIGYGAQAFGTNFNETGVAIGTLSQVTNGGVAIGPYTIVQDGVAIGNNSQSEGRGVAIGKYAIAPGGTVDGTELGGVAIGPDATSTTNMGVAIGGTAAAEGNGVAIGYNADSRGGTNGGIALGHLADVYEGVGIGVNAEAIDGIAIGAYADDNLDGIAIGRSAITTSGIAIGNSALSDFGVQLGTGTNNGTNTIQFLTAGGVTTNTWSALANSTTFGRYVFAAPTNGTNGQILALNSNATAVIWKTETGGTANLTNVTGTLAVANGGTGATNGAGALTNLGVLGSSLVVIGGANVTGGNTIVGSGATADDGSGLGGVAIGRSAVVSNSAVGIGYSVLARDMSGGTGIGGVAIGYQATNISSGGGAIGYRATSTNGGAIGKEAAAFDGFAGGELAKANAADAVQLGTGTLTNANSIQFLSAGAIDTNEWSRLAAISTYPTTNISVVGTNNTNTLVFSNGILVEVQ